MDAQELKRGIEEFLAAHHVATLATATGEGTAHAASLMYAVDGLSLLWMSDPATRHSRHLEREPRVTATIAPDYADFRAIRGLQIAGSARRLRDVLEVERAKGLLRSRYAFLGQLSAGPLDNAALREALDKAGFYRLEPERITLIDNSKEFGHKESLRVKSGREVVLVPEDQ